MKTAIGFVCGIAGMILSIVVFVVGCMCGYSLNEHEHATSKKKTNSYAEWFNKKEN